MQFGLERMHKLMTALGIPQRRFASIHVVGTNGKSSTVRFTAALLERRGLRTGSYTSPHLGSFTERIEVGEKPVAGPAFEEAVARVRGAAELVDRASEQPVTQFEALTAAAFHEFARAGAQVAVIEAGLGGRHDATNVIPSSVQVLTGVALEHTRWLGTSLAGIAEEKLAVVRDHGCLVTPPGLAPEVEAVAARVAAEHSAERYGAGEDLGLELRARGRFQRGNFALAVTAAQSFLARAGLPPLKPDEIIAAARRTEIPGRLQVVDTDPLTL
ncbi:MAG: dihydrofolate synthase, partial [Thermoleophilaceae bacterium]|nr:dihydrofolate synthase [Thermoleophilaceae bacterium]